MEIKEVLITPAQAATWLEEGNVHNRSVRDNAVNRYARDMKAGRWRLTHRGIAFAPDGTLIDGQHRLWAIVEADTAIKMMVARGVPPEAQAVIDDNLPRTIVDSLKLAYDTPANTLQIAIAKRILGERLKDKASRQEVIATFAKHREAIVFATSAFPRSIRGVTVAPVLTPIARAWYTQNRDRLLRFVAVLAEGRLSSDIEEPAFILRNWLLEGAPVRKAGVNREQTIYGKTARALSAFLHEESVGILYAASSELFPLANETDERMQPATRKLRVLKKAKGA